MELTYPSEEHPAPPEISLTLPDSWRPVRHPDLLLAAVDADSPEGFAVNLTVAVQPAPADAQLADLVDELIAREQAARPATTVEGREEVAVEGREAIWTVKVVEGADAPGAFLQADVTLLVTRTGGGQDLVRAVGICPGQVADRYGPVFRSAFASLTIG